MNNLRMRMATAATVVCLGLVMASPIAAQQGQGQGQGQGGGNGGSNNGNGGNNGNAGNNGNVNGNGNAFGVPSPAETPALSSLVLFGTGAAGAAGYALMRIRAGRRQDGPRGTH